MTNSLNAQTFDSDLYSIFDLEMWKLVFLLAILTLSLTQNTPKCSVCLKVKRCEKNLFDDSFVDPIFNYLVKKIAIKTYPFAIRKEVGLT